MIKNIDENIFVDILVFSNEKKDIKNKTNTIQEILVKFKIKANIDNNNIIFRFTFFIKDILLLK
jgi:hypothetical protein